MNQCLNKSVEWSIQWLTYKNSCLLLCWMNQCGWMNQFSKWFNDSLIQTVISCHLLVWLCNCRKSQWKPPSTNTQEWHKQWEVTAVNWTERTNAPSPVQSHNPLSLSSSHPGLFSDSLKVPSRIKSVLRRFRASFSSYNLHISLRGFKRRYLKSQQLSWDQRVFMNSHLYCNTHIHQSQPRSDDKIKA